MLIEFDIIAYVHMISDRGCDCVWLPLLPLCALPDNGLYSHPGQGLQGYLGNKNAPTPFSAPP